jgi:hypothetical protein
LCSASMAVTVICHASYFASDLAISHAFHDACASGI